MGRRENTSDSPTISIGLTGSELIQPDALFWRVKNLYPTEEGGYRSVCLPLPILFTAAGDVPSDAATASVTGPVYARTKGIFHAMIRGRQREVLLLHTGTQIWELWGWDRAWRCLIGPASASPFVEADLPDDNAVRFPTQFVATPTGVVIVPQDGRAYFYDGEGVLPLGYDHAPGPPVGRGPESSGDEWFPDPNEPFLGVNDLGYTVDALPYHPPSSMHPVFRYGRVGTVSTPGNISTLANEPGDKAQVMGYLEPGRYRARYRWIDKHGNLSPWSEPSNDITFRRQPSQTIDGAAPTYNTRWVHADLVLKQVAWDAIMPGPLGTIGRDVARTKDLVNSGSDKYWQLPIDSMVNTDAFATLPDNVSRLVPDNIPDAWLVTEIEDIVPVPQFKIAALAFGRMFIANFLNDEGAVLASMVGRYGTFERRFKFYPDPGAAEITGMHAVVRGLLIFTENSTFIIESNDAGDGFRPAPLSTTIGCVAPSSIVTMRNGLTVWLGRDGFYGYDGSAVTYLFSRHRQIARSHNLTRLKQAVACFDPNSGQYRCWVAIGGSLRNNRCYTFNGSDWHHRDEVWADGVTVSQDERKQIFVSGYRDDISREGVWVQDTAGEAVKAEVTTAWIRAQRSDTHASIRRVYLWLRETGNFSADANKIQVGVRRDYRAELETQFYIPLYPEVAEEYATVGLPTFWGDTTTPWGTTGAAWRTRRPFWAMASVDIPDCEVFQLEISCAKRFEILGFRFEERPIEERGQRGY